MSNTTVVLYHANCADGFGAAWAAWKELGDEAVYIPVQYGKPYPAELDGGVWRLFLVDFSYPLETLNRLSAVAGEMVVIDHHQSAQDDVYAWNRRWGVNDPHHLIFDLKKSGAVLTWEYFHPRWEPVPDLLEYVQDRDLWRWELQSSKEVAAAVASYPFDFEVWDQLAEDARRDNGMVHARLARQGEAIFRYQQQQVERHVATARLQEVGGYQVPVTNATALMSEIGEALCQKFPEAPFSATFFVREDGKRVYSLRSRNGFDVSEVAKAMGGGGHKAAAGFTEV